MRIRNCLQGDVHVDLVSIPALGTVIHEGVITDNMQKAIDAGHIEILPEPVTEPVAVVGEKPKRKSKPKAVKKNKAAAKPKAKSLEPEKATVDSAVSLSPAKPRTRKSKVKA